MISWHPDGPTRIAVGYAIQRFQQMPEKMPSDAYIWDINNPNNPTHVLQSPSPVCCIKYNHKQTETIAAGCYNGLVLYWDLRQKKQNAMGHHAFEKTVDVKEAHHDPVTDLVWRSDKAGSKFVTTSTDGRICWWDFRKMSAPTD